MNVAQLAERIGTERGVGEDQAREVIDDVFRALAYALHTDKGLDVPGLGRFLLDHGPDLRFEHVEPTPPDVLDDLQAASAEFLSVASRSADGAERRGNEIDRDIEHVRRILTEAEPT